MCKITKFYSAKYFLQYTNSSATDKMVNSCNNFLTAVYTGCSGENDDTHKSSKFWIFKTKEPWKTQKPSWGY